MNANYYQYLEQVNSLNIFEKITYELLLVQKNKKFIEIYSESRLAKEDKAVADAANIINLAQKFNISEDQIPILKESFLFFKPELKQSIDSYLFDLKIATSFGLGIGTLIPSVMGFLEKTNISITKENAILLSVGVLLGVIYTKQREVAKIKRLFRKIIMSIRDKKLKNTFKIFKILAKKLWIPIEKLFEFIAYSIMAIPMSNLFLSFLREHKFNPQLVNQALTGLGLAMLFQVLRRTPILWRKFSNFFKIKKKLNYD